VERFRVGALVRVTPRTGRTHQIRVHLAAVGAPVLCDGLYSGRTVIEPAWLGLPPGPPLLERQALHAARLELDHPITGERLRFEAPLPADMERMLAALRAE
jgi:23S rRNA pseudouridine1911/1915/1917 synthase